jgi:SAM-dependent methyltransferase
VRDLPRVFVAWPERRLVASAPTGFVGALRDAIQALRDLRPDSRTLIDVSDKGTQVSFVVVQSPHPDESFARQLGPSVEPLVALCKAAGGHCLPPFTGLTLWLQLPLDPSTPPAERDPFRPRLPEDHTFEQRYAAYLARSSWATLRAEVFRFSMWAERAARYAARHGLRTALCPAVGINADPWIFASLGARRVVALDLAPSALAAVGHPERWPRLYSRAAQSTWELETCCSWVGGLSPYLFHGLRDLARPEVRAELGPRVIAVQADQRQAPLPDRSIDVLFACNALPRASAAELARTLAEWQRVLRPGGYAFIRMFNADALCERVRASFGERGWTAIDPTDPVAPEPGPVGAFWVQSEGL